MIEFEVKGRSFRAEKLNAIQQFHVLRRITPLVVPLLEVLKGSFKQSGAKGAEPEGERAATMADSILESPKVLAPLLEQIAELPDASVEYLIETCLSSLKVRTADNAFMPVWVPSAKRSMVEELNDISAVLPLVVRVIQENLGGFFGELPTFLPGATRGS